MITQPARETQWRRKSDGRIDTVKGGDGSWSVLMYSSETNRHWHIQLKNFYRKYEALP
jgi:hypothetical protein